MIRKIDATPTFLKMHVSRHAARYLKFEGLLAGGLPARIRAMSAERRLARHTEGQWEASGPEFEQLCDEWKERQNTASLGKPFDEDALQKIQKIRDAGIPEPYIRNWVVNRHIDAGGLVVKRVAEPKISLTRVLGWTWHFLTAFTTILFLVYALALPGPILNKLFAIVLILSVFGILSSLMNSQSLSALPPSIELRSLIKKVLCD